MTVFFLQTAASFRQETVRKKFSDRPGTAEKKKVFKIKSSR